MTDGIESTDRLFVYRREFEDEGTRWFCPYSAQVTGYLAYFPAVRGTLELVELDFQRPRRALAALVGEENQAAPCLVLGAASKGAVAGVTIEEHHGQRFVTRTIEILRYLAATRGTPPPH